MKRFRNIVILMLIALCALNMTSCSKNEAATTTSNTTAVEKKAEVKYPTKTINITVPYGAGSLSDIRLRFLAQELSNKLGETVTVTNVKGAAGTIGVIDYFTKNADPHEILLAGIATMTTAPLTNPQLPYTFNDFKVIKGLDVEEQIIYACPAKSGIRTFDDLVKLGKERIIKYGGGGPNAANDIIQAAAYKKSGMQYESIVTTSTSQRIIDVVSGTTDVTVAPPASGAEFVKSGELVPIAVLSPEDFTGFEGITVPSLEKMGYEGYNFNSYNMILMNAKVDDAYVEIISNAIAEIYASEEYQAKAAEMGMNICTDTPEETAERVKATKEAFRSMLELIK